jgi:cell division protein FtsI (penicillin-binding protein 3)
LRGKWGVTFPRDSAILLQNRFVVNDLMPNVKGMGLRDALYILNRLGLKVEVIGEGTVVYQSINPSIKIKKGQEVILKLM